MPARICATPVRSPDEICVHNDGCFAVHALCAAFRDLTLSEAASLLPSFLLPPDTDLAALPAPAARTGDLWREDGALVGGCAARGHVAGAPAPVSASRLHPLSVTPSSYGRAESDYRMCALFGINSEKLVPYSNSYANDSVH